MQCYVKRVYLALEMILIGSNVQQIYYLQYFFRSEFFSSKTLDSFKIIILLKLFGFYFEVQQDKNIQNTKFVKCATRIKTLRGYILRKNYKI